MTAKKSRSTVRYPFVALSLAMAVAAGATLVWAADPVPPATAPSENPARDAFLRAKDLNDSGKIEEANAEIDNALKIDPNYQNARLLKAVIQARLAEAAGNAPTPRDANTPEGPGKARYLSPQQISLIRLHELPDTDTKLQGRIDTRDVQAFWDEIYKNGRDVDASSAARGAFIRQDNFTNQVFAIRKSGSAKYLQKITLTSEPSNMIQYKKRVSTFVLQNCATAVCHGGEKAPGDFRLYTGQSDAAIYTNFYIMTHYTAKTGGKLIDRNTPEDSLIIQYCLPRPAARFQHPGKPEMRMHFVDTKSPDAMAIADWIRTLAFPQPNYGITYELPGTEPPATAPAPPAPAPKPPAPAPKAPPPATPRK